MTAISTIPPHQLRVQCAILALVTPLTEALQPLAILGLLGSLFLDPKRVTWKGVLKIVAMPIVLSEMTLVALYGILDPKRGALLYGSLEQWFWGGPFLAKSFA